MKSSDNKPLICDSLWNERQAHFAMQQSKEQVIKDGIRARNARTRLDEQLRKERVQEAFYAKLWVTLNSIFVLIIISTIIHFARG